MSDKWHLRVHRCFYYNIYVVSYTKNYLFLFLKYRGNSPAVYYNGWKVPQFSSVPRIE